MTIDDLKGAFFTYYGTTSNNKVQMYFSPGRVNLIGEHTDYNGGFVFPCALSFGTYMMVRRTDDDLVKFKSLNQEYNTEIKISDLEKPHPKQWVNYPLGVFDQFKQKGIVPDPGLEIMYWGNVPTGAGLSSSASLEVVTAYALNDILETGYERVELVKMSQRAENEFVGVNCGIMDQFASAFGKAGHAVFLNCDTLEYELVPVKLEGVKVVISNTNSPHSLDAGQYNQRVAECQTAVKQISQIKPIKNLAELSWDDFLKVQQAITDETAKKRARHVVAEIQRTVNAVDALKANKIAEFGQMMNASHKSLRDDYEVTGPELDAMAEEAWKIDGVIGSRMTGGGFGGCTVSLVKEEALDTFIEQVGANYEKRTNIKPEFYVAEIGDGSKLIDIF
ncbi:MAG: galactokinase [Bacteroidota bacterium]